jgi:hypothetical protein
VGRLAKRNPAYVLPALRRHLLQLLVELEHSADTAHKESSARLLGILIKSCSRSLLSLRLILFTRTRTLTLTFTLTLTLIDTAQKGSSAHLLSILSKSCPS